LRPAAAVAQANVKRHKEVPFEIVAQLSNLDAHTFLLNLLFYHPLLLL
jgi:hypothetical protein